jgi:hypothetical protein
MSEITQRGLRPRTAQIRRFLAALAACSFVLLASQMLVVSYPASAASVSSCSELRRWAEPYRDSSPTLERVASLDRQHRIAVLNVLRPETQAALWREHLRQFTQQPDLSTDQRGLIAEGILLTTPALYRHDQAANRAMDNLDRRIRAQFTSRAQALPWVDLGTLSAPTPQRVSLWDRLSAPLRAEAQSQWCECTSQASEFWCPGSCGNSGSCHFGTGCGLDGRSICDGMCM